MIAALLSSAVTLSLYLAASTVACAQMAGVEGTWSWESPGGSGIDRNSIEFRPDGSFERVGVLANGTSVRYRGLYRATPASGSDVLVETQTQGWLPSVICTQAPGFAARCNPAPHPPEWDFPVTLVPDGTMRAKGLTLTRDPGASVMAYQVPGRLNLAVHAPTQPNIRQPVMPTLRPYTTPNGPGLAIANANHANAQSFINHHMRSCYDGTDGRLYGCEQ